MGIKSKLFQKRVAWFLLLYLAVFLFSPVVTTRVQAAALTEASIRLDRMGASVAANTSTAKILVVFKPTSTATEGKLVITWPTSSAFTVSSTDADHTVTDTGIPATYQGESLVASGITSPGAETAGVVTYTIPDATPGTLYGFFITGGITNPSAGNAGTHLVTIATTTAADAAIDSSSIAVDTVGTNSDQVSITASVPATFNFAIADNALALGTLSTGGVSTNAMSSPIDVDTKANNGWIAWIRSEGGAATLASASSGDAVSSTNTGSPVTCSAGTECYVIDAASAAGGGSVGTVTEATEYAGNGTTSGGVISTTYEEIASSNGPAANDTITLTAIVAISPVNEAATDYTDTLEVVGAGNF